MKFQIMHESEGRVRLRAMQDKMSIEQADLLESWLLSLPEVTHVSIHERICGVTIAFHGDRAELYRKLAAFSYENAAPTVQTGAGSSRAMNRHYKEKLISQVVSYFLRAAFLPDPLRWGITACQVLLRIQKAAAALVKGKLSVDVLDGISLGVSMLTGDFSTAGAVVFLLEIGETLDEWTHKKSVADLAKSMSLQIDRVWQITTDGSQNLIPIDQIKPDDLIVVHTGHVIPLDGILEQGEVMLNQASLTGESVPVSKRPGAAVYAGSVVEEGNCIIRVTGGAGENRYDRIVRMIEDSERLNSGAENRAYDLADRLVPWCLGGSLLTLALTGNTTRAVSVLMVDFSCALKLSMPLSVLSAMTRKEEIKSAYKSLGKSHGLYDGMMLGTTFFGRLVLKFVWGMTREDALEYQAAAFEPIPQDFSGKLLEIPVGTGVISMPVFKTMPKADITCVDYSEKMMESAESRAREMDISNIRFQQGDVGSLPFPDDCFDTVVSLNGFHAFPNKEAAYRETYRVLKPGGIFTGCFYIQGGNAQTDRMIRRFYIPRGFFTPPFETKESLQTRLAGMYTKAEVLNIQSIAVFHCRK